METRHSIRRAVRITIRPAALLLAVVLPLMAVGFGVAGVPEEPPPEAATPTATPTVALPTATDTVEPPTPTEGPATTPTEQPTEVPATPTEEPTATPGAGPALTFEGSCTPDPVRPREPVLISCTTHVTNTGDETATNLMVTIGVASRCTVPSRFVFLDRTMNGELVAVPPMELSFVGGDLAPGATVETVTRLAVLNTVTGPTGGQVTIRSQDDPSVEVSGDVCWQVDSDAAAPPANLQVTRTLLSTIIFPEPLPLPVPALPPSGATAGVETVVVEPAPVTILPGEPPLPVPVPVPGLEQAEFEIVVSNVSDRDLTGVTILEAPTGDAVLVGAAPPPSTDAVGRPTWDAGTLAPGEQFRVVLTYGAPPEGNCAFADGVAVVTATPAGGEPEGYAAFADYGVNVGPCVVEPIEYCNYYPPEGDPWANPCDQELCWSTPPGSTELWAVWDCSGDQEFCWFLPPGDAEGYPALRPCTDEVCWISSGDAFYQYTYEYPCGLELCRYTAPDGSNWAESDCTVPVCWTQPPGTQEWWSLWDCGASQEFCWFTPPGEGYPGLRNCADEVLWLPYLEGDREFFYEVPPGVDYCRYLAPDGSNAVQDQCEFPICWSAPPEGGSWQPIWGCGQYEELCWFSAPGGAAPSQLGSCLYPLRLAINPPAGAVDTNPQSIYGEGDFCWPAPDADVSFYTYPMLCSDIEFLTWFLPPDGSPAFFSWGDAPPCLPPDGDGILAGGGVREAPSPIPCEEESDFTTVPGISVPAEIVDAISTPVELVDGIVEPVEPLPSASVTPAETVDGTVERVPVLPSADVLRAAIIRAVRVEVLPPGEFPYYGIDGRGGPIPVAVPTSGPEEELGYLDERDGDQSALLQPPGYPSEPNASALPATGARAPDGGSGLPWSLAAGLAIAGLLLTATSLAVHRRRSL